MKSEADDTETALTQHGRIYVKVITIAAAFFCIYVYRRRRESGESIGRAQNCVTELLELQCNLIEVDSSADARGTGFTTRFL